MICHIRTVWIWYPDYLKFNNLLQFLTDSFYNKNAIWMYKEYAYFQYDSSYLHQMEFVCYPEITMLVCSLKVFIVHMLLLICMDLVYYKNHDVDKYPDYLFMHSICFFIFASGGIWFTTKAKMLVGSLTLCILNMLCHISMVWIRFAKQITM